MENHNGKDHDIQSHLETLNERIEVGTEVQARQHTSSEDQQIVDPSKQYYYQQERGDEQCQVMAIVSEIDDRPIEGDQEAVYIAMHSPDEKNSYRLITGSNSSQDVAAADSETINEMVVDTEDTYPTVTIVPSGSNSEVSYIVIVQPEEKTDDQELTVYDFVDESVTLESGDEDRKAEIVKIVPKQSQIVKQTHTCNFCDYSSAKKYLLLRHMRSHSEDRPHKCSVCERGFKTVASLQNHVNTHTGTKPHRCRFCDNAFTTSGELVRHVRYRHTHEKPHKCTECDYASVELSKLKRHIRCHSGERPYQCPHCTYASPDTFKLKRHLRIHTGEKPYHCDVCHARFTQSNSLKAHRLIHTGKRPVFKCELCPTTCGRKTDLRTHVQKLHTADRPLKCNRCEKSFPDRYSYKIHKKTHEGEKCFKCNLCPYASMSQRHLESHMCVHTDQKPFQCDQCDQSFRQGQLLKRHQNLYHNPEYIPPVPQEKIHECPECGRAFRHKGNLIRHLPVHDPECSAHVDALALKLGRQKKVHIINSEQVVVEEGDDELSDDAMFSVRAQDGEQYVVLEVVQLQSDDGHEEAFTLTNKVNDTPRTAQQSVATFQRINRDTGSLLPEYITPDSHMEDGDGLHSPKEEKLLETPRKRLETENEIKNCFGFEDDDNESIDEDVDIQLLETDDQ